jgi:hypothetical protein
MSTDSFRRSLLLESETNSELAAGNGSNLGNESGSNIVVESLETRTDESTETGDETDNYY